jgi:magnesium-transporting ATPase (P-type)
MNYRKIFQVISYLQYPFILIALYFAVKPYFNGFDYLVKNPDKIFYNYNYVLIFIGLGISFSTLQDTTKTQNNFSKKIWENPKKGKLFIGILSFFTFIILTFGIFGYFITNNENIQQLSFGTIVLGIGFIGFLKTALDVFENHRLDKKTTQSNE